MFRNKPSSLRKMIVPTLFISFKAGGLRLRFSPNMESKRLSGQFFGEGCLDNKTNTSHLIDHVTVEDHGGQVLTDDFAAKRVGDE